MVEKSLSLENVDDNVDVNTGSQPMALASNTRQVWVVRVCSTLTIFTTIGLLVYLKYQGDFDSKQLYEILNTLVNSEKQQI